MSTTCGGIESLCIWGSSVHRFGPSGRRRWQRYRTAQCVSSCAKRRQRRSVDNTVLASLLLIREDRMPTAQIVIDRVSHYYRPPRGREVRALDGVSLEVGASEFVALL